MQYVNIKSIQYKQHLQSQSNIRPDDEIQNFTSLDGGDSKSGIGINDDLSASVEPDDRSHGAVGNNLTNYNPTKSYQQQYTTQALGQPFKVMANYMKNTLSREHRLTAQASQERLS